MNIHIHHFHSKGPAAEQAALEQFQTQWATYQKLVDTDSLAHKEVGAILHKALAAIPAPFAFLNIGWADEGRAHGHQGRALSRHRSVGAGARACGNESRGRPFEVELDHRDFVTALTQRPEPADAAWCGLSIHHLSTEGKRDLLKAVRGSTSGFLMIYEPSLSDGETREAYLERFRGVNRPAWTFMTEDEWDQIDHHVTTCDYPESVATWLALGREAGFSDAVRAFTAASLNGRRSQVLVDPTRDLTEIGYTFGSSNWILPLTEPMPPKGQRWQNDYVETLKAVRYTFGDSIMGSCP